MVSFIFASISSLASATLVSALLHPRPQITSAPTFRPDHALLRRQGGFGEQVTSSIAVTCGFIDAYIRMYCTASPSFASPTLRITDHAQSLLWAAIKAPSVHRTSQPTSQAPAADLETSQLGIVSRRRNASGWWTYQGSVGGIAVRMTGLSSGESWVCEDIGMSGLWLMEFCSSEFASRYCYTRYWRA